MVSESGADEAALSKTYGEIIPLDPELAKQMLKETKEVMDSAGIPFFLGRARALARSETRPSSHGTTT